MRKPWIKQRQSGAMNPKILLAIAVVALIAVGMFITTREEPDPLPMVSAPIEPKPAPTPPVLPDIVEQAPDIPLIEPDPEPALVEEPPAPPLPLLTESDEFARETLGGLHDDSEFVLWLQADNLLQKATSIIDGFSRGNMLYKLIPIQPPHESFKIVKQDDRIYLDEANYRRFDQLTEMLTSISPDALAAAFQTMRPLFEEAYAGLGNPADKVDNGLIAAIDLALETPEVTEPIALKQESVLYQFADPDIESLPAIQKQLIRMGPENRGKIQSYLNHVREALLHDAE